MSVTTLGRLCGDGFSVSYFQWDTEGNMCCHYTGIIYKVRKVTYWFVVLSFKIIDTLL